MYFIAFVVFFKIITYLKLFELNKKNIIWTALKIWAID